MSKEAKHTPEPWGIGVAYKDEITGFWQCKITRNGVAFITVSGISEDECEANARLITAAPKLLGMLNRVYEAEFGYGSWPTESEVQKTIAEARVS